MPFYCKLRWCALSAVMLSACVSTDDGTPSGAANHLGEKSNFDAADDNGDGVLSMEEVADYYHDEAIALCDLDKDGQISEAEWNRAQPATAETDARFKAIDRDGDKKLSRAEAVKWVTEHVSFGDAFRKHDEAGDSRLRWRRLNQNAPAELRLTIFSMPIG